MRQIEQPCSDIDTKEKTALALAHFYNQGYDGHIPTYAEEAVAYYREINAGVEPNTEVADEKKE